MIERIEEKFWRLLEGKQVSLAMIYDERGAILWNKGRSIKGVNISDCDCQGFCKEAALRAIYETKRIGKKDDWSQINYTEESEPVSPMMIKSLLILPMGEKHFLYLDSRSRSSYSDLERGGFFSMGLFFFETIMEWFVNPRQDYVSLQGVAKDSLMQRVIRYILSRSDEELQNLSVKSLAAKFNVTRRVLEYEFERGAINIADYIDRYRLKRAARMLKTLPDLKIEEIAGRVGFASCKHFKHRFKMQYGVLPRQYRVSGQ